MQMYSKKVVICSLNMDNTLGTKTNKILYGTASFQKVI